jgi:3-hydroxybutyryl-CoA dehydrogenase
MPIQTVAVIGAGTAGRAFALRCAAAGFDVVLEDVMPEKLSRAQDDYAALAITAGSLRYALTVEDAVHCADIAIDFVPDELESKLEIFSLLDRMAPPRTILCTPTRTLSITDLASCTYRPTLCIGLQADMTHVVKGRFTSAEAVDAVVAMFSAIGNAVTVIEDSLEPMLVKNFSPLPGLKPFL